jgi:hypothetical protein
MGSSNWGFKQKLNDTADECNNVQCSNLAKGRRACPKFYSVINSRTYIYIQFIIIISFYITSIHQTFTLIIPNYTENSSCLQSNFEQHIEDEMRFSVFFYFLFTLHNYYCCELRNYSVLRLVDSGNGFYFFLHFNVNHCLIWCYNEKL